VVDEDPSGNLDEIGATEQIFTNLKTSKPKMM
jgi:hypothetical protein